ncbi:uncharacterized protein LOC113316084 [Papaver somniferum]|uniref:uncharacterized protein LOC113316084 n=1 Tax=Papaver somniferum TaxID=3469 RepID=UPI000E700609|nr:uncharacterized protein LOC113316084 [Papaver somniferum]
MSIKLDLSKAFDRLEWSFIIVVFEKLGFSDDWCQLVFQYISTVSYSVLVNGSPSESFLPSRGIRQGDCLSPYIFILCMEVLSQLLSKAEDENLIRGFRFRQNSPSISHLFFADDCMLFCKASVTYAKNIIKVINVFAKASGQAINFDKSEFITSGNMHHRHIKILSKALNMKFLSSSEKYLGTPLFIGKDKTKSFSFLMDNFYARLNSSIKSNLNIAGRTVVTKYVLSSLCVYHMACFPLPKTVTSKIDSIQHTFWWAKKNPKHAAYFRSWGDIGKSKLNGGLGLKNSFATNRVFICKLGWRILKNQGSLLTRFLKDKYFPNQNILEIDKAADSASWMWKDIIKGLIFIKANSVVKINNGVLTPIWNASWIPGNVLPPSPMNTACNEFVYVSELIDYNHNFWNVPLLNLLFSPDEVIRIKSIRLNLLQSDSLMWAHTRNGKFTIKSAYRIYMNDIPSPEDSTFWRKVWYIDCLPKVKFFMWKMFAHMLPVNSIMQLYNPHVNVLFSFRNTHDETMMHLFVNCPVVLRIWFSLSLQHLISTDLDWVDDIFLYWHESSLGASPFKVGWPSVGAIVMWSIWKLRCDVVFKSASLDMNKIIVDIKRMLNSYIAPRITVMNLVHNVKIPQSEVENFMFVDGSFKDFNFGIDVIWCDAAGNVRKVHSNFRFVQDAVGAEAAALSFAISWAEEMNLPKVVFDSDCLQLVHFVNGRNISVGWRSQDLLEQCRSSIYCSVSFNVMYIKRLNNPLADRLARRARKNNIKGLWFSLPNFLDGVFRKINLSVICNFLVS